MADIAIDSDVLGTGNLPRDGSASFLLVDVSSSILYQFYTDADGSLVYKKSTDGGQTWGSIVSVAAVATYAPMGASIWFDKWTSGDTGTKIHIAWGDTVNERTYYRSLDTASDTLSSPVIASDFANLGTDDSTRTAITKSRGGYLFIKYSGWSGSAYVGEFLRSIDSGVNWTARTNLGEDSDNGEAKLVLLPANLADANDMWCVYMNDLDHEVSLKTYDDSANSWSEVSISAGANQAHTNDIRQLAASIRHSDGHMILAINTHVDNAAGDLLIFDITDAGTITAKTSIITNKDDWAGVTVYIDQNTNDIYVGWLGNPDGTETWTATVTVWRSVSTDDGATWATPVQYSQDAADDFRAIWSSHSTPGAAAGRFMLSWFDDDDNDLFTNYANSVEITVAAAGILVQDMVGGDVVPFER